MGKRPGRTVRLGVLRFYWDGVNDRIVTQPDGDVLSCQAPSWRFMNRPRSDGTAEPILGSCDVLSTHVRHMSVSPQTTQDDTTLTRRKCGASWRSTGTG